MSVILDASLIALGWAYVLLAPYTKVEESFNLHAMHDVLMYGVSPTVLPKYDHFVFPGAVPRTFIGSICLAWISTPVMYIADTFHLLNNKFDIQILIRLVLATINALGLSLIRRGTESRFGRNTSLFFVLLTCTQFHILFWMGRTLPNMFALFPVSLAWYYFVSKSPSLSQPKRRDAGKIIALLTFAAVVFRSELALLLAPLALQFLVTKRISILKLIKTGLATGLLSIALTVLVDSYFWGQWPLWPEFSGIYFNVFEGKSSEWGVSPFHTYFTSFLPKLLLGSLPLSFLGAILDRRVSSLLFPVVLFVLFISCLGHKEWRFVIYIVPIFNVAAARAATWLVSRPKSSWLGRLAFLSVFGLLAINSLATFVFLQSSRANYPGGEALARFNGIYSNEHQVSVHISNLAAQTGASLFLQEHSPPYPFYLQRNTVWIYDKTESMPTSALSKFTHLIEESPNLASNGWEHVEQIDGFAGWQLRPWKGQLSGLTDILSMRKLGKLWVLAKSSGRR